MDKRFSNPENDRLRRMALEAMKLKARKGISPSAAYDPEIMAAITHKYPGKKISDDAAKLIAGALKAMLRS